MKFTSATEITAKAATIKAYVREAIAVEKAGLRLKPKRTSDYPVPEELSERFRRDPRFRRAFEALTPGRQRSYLYHIAAAKQSATRMARIEKALPAIQSHCRQRARTASRRIQAPIASTSSPRR